MRAVDQVARMTRWRSTSRTWFSKTTRLLVALHDQDDIDVRWLVGYEAASLLADVLGDAEELVRVLGDDHLPEVARLALALSDRLRAERLALMLDRTDGRTDAEKEAFRAKASALRAGQ